MLGRFWKYGAGGLVVYLVTAYSYLAYRHMLPVTHVAMTAPGEKLRASTTPVAATRLSGGTGGFSFRNTRKTIQKKTTQNKKTSQDTKTIQYEKTPQHTKTIQNEKTPQHTKTIQNEKTPQHTKTIQNEKTPQHTKTIQYKKTPQHTKTIQNEKTPQHTKTIQNEKTSEDTKTIKYKKTPQHKKTIQNEKTPQHTKTIPNEKTPQHTKTIQNEKTSQDTKTIQYKKTPQHKKTIQNEKTPQHTKTIPNEKTHQDTKTIQNKKTPQHKKTIQNEKTPQGKAKTRTESGATGMRTNGSSASTTDSGLPVQGSVTPTSMSTMKQTRKLKEMPVLTPVFKGRLGNQLFEYAASFAIAKLKNMSLFIPEGNVINKLFHVDKTVVTFHGCSSWRRVLVECCGYNPDLITTINKNECQAIGLYLQSWKYFKPVEASIRRQLTFKRNIALVANRKLLSLTQEFLRRQSGWPTDRDDDQGNWTSTHVGIPATQTGGAINSSLLHPGNADHSKKTQKKRAHEAGAEDIASNLTYIGMHVRRGDYMSPQSRRQGRITPPAEYYIHAMRYFRAKFPNTLFVVAGDDGSWVNRNIGAPDVVVVQRDTEEVDLCVLSMCNHTVLSVGTFGWWAGFLAGGTTVYYKHPYRNNTAMSRWYSNFHSDYVLPDWVPMD